MTIKAPPLSDDPEFNEGDLVLYDNPRTRGVVYRVVTVTSVVGTWAGKKAYQYRIVPVFGSFGAAQKKPSRNDALGSELKKLTLLDLGTEANKMLQFVKTAAQQMGGQLQPEEAVDCAHGETASGPVQDK